jgi:hypothetical protein
MEISKILTCCSMLESPRAVKARAAEGERSNGQGRSGDERRACGSVSLSERSEESQGKR